MLGAILGGVAGVIACDFVSKTLAPTVPYAGHAALIASGSAIAGWSDTAMAREVGLGMLAVGAGMAFASIRANASRPLLAAPALPQIVNTPRPLITTTGYLGETKHFQDRVEPYYTNISTL